MTAAKLILEPVTVVVASCYFFPFVPAALPAANSKMLLAVVGLACLAYNLIKKREGSIDRDFLILSLYAFGISLIASLSMVLNNTGDNTFSAYFMSMWVWLGGAYAVVTLIKYVHSGISVPLIVNYLIAVCVVQCLLALLFESSPAAESWHTATFDGQGFMGNTAGLSRLHGIGCSLDVAGFRFAAVIIMATVLMSMDDSSINQYIYITAIFLIAVIGDIISRSTVFGVLVGAVYLLVRPMFVKTSSRGIASKLVIIAIISTVICIILYNTNAAAKENIRFGFEGFFSLAERGEWQTNSNDILKSMVVWPDNLRTWIIGDGFFNNPTDDTQPTFDPFYIGPTYHGFYKNTDIGYLRYIYYFGLVGLSLFIMYYIRICKICVRRFPSFKWMFILLLALNFIQWLKVSTDLFVVFAPFLCMSRKENDEYMEGDEEFEPEAISA